MWHDTSIFDTTHSCVTWRIHIRYNSFMCDMTHSYLARLIHVWHDAFIIIIILILTTLIQDQTHCFRLVLLISHRLGYQTKCWQRNSLQHAATRYNTLILLFYDRHGVSDQVLRRTVAVQYAATRCNTRCNTLQHAATRCNILILLFYDRHGLSDQVLRHAVAVLVEEEGREQVSFSNPFWERGMWNESCHACRWVMSHGGVMSHTHIWRTSVSSKSRFRILFRSEVFCVGQDTTLVCCWRHKCRSSFSLSLTCECCTFVVWSRTFAVWLLQARATYNQVYQWVMSRISMSHATYMKELDHT